MLGSVLLVVDAASVARVTARAAQLPLAEDAVVTIVEIYADTARVPLELHALGMVGPHREIRCCAIGALDRGALRTLVRLTRPELVVAGDIGLWGWRVESMLGEVPMLVVRAALVERYQRPVVAIDARTGAVEVLRFARAALATMQPQMTAVHAASTVGDHARAVIASLLASLGAFGAGWTRYLGRGDARTVIAKAATEGRADLVVVGRRRRTALSRLVFGSVSGGVLRDSSCDVLIVPVPAVTAELALPRAISGVP